MRRTVLPLFSTLLVAVCCASTPAPVIASETPHATSTQPIAVKSLGQLARLLHLHLPQHLSLQGGIAAGTGSTGNVIGAPTVAAGASGSGTSVSSAADFSATNVQVTGVDEGDFVKTDGEYIYQISQGQVLVIHALPATNLTLTSTLDLGSNFYPTDLYVQQNRLVVTGSFYQTPVLDPILNPVNDTTGVAFPIFSPAETQVLIFDISDKTNIKQLRKIGIDGGIVSSRRIGNFVYLVTRVYPQFVFDRAASANTPGAKRPKRQKRNKVTQTLCVPLLRDTAKSDSLQPIPLSNIFVFPKFAEPDFITTVGFDIQDPTSPVDVKAFLGGSENIYASTSSLYVQASHFYPIPVAEPDVPNTASGITPKGALHVRPLQVDSTIYKFALTSGTVSYTAQADVPGQVFNSFSMDENNGQFRVATTSNAFQSTQSSGVYVFDAGMTQLGKVENIAPGEQIFSARFIGDRAYLVTFHRVDPLFVIGLSNPAAPTVLGQVVLTGVSDYLQPYDETHLLGFGSNTDSAGRLTGFKMSFFDVTDAANPKEINSVVVPNGSSEVQYDHRALLFDKSKNLLAIPLVRYSVTSNGNGGGPNPIPLLGSATTLAPSTVIPILPVIQDVDSVAQVYDISVDNGFVLRKEVKPTDIFDFVHRILYASGSLYIVSDGQVNALDLSTLTPQSSLNLPTQPMNMPGVGVGSGFTSAAHAQF
jgi:inhibitor of cysteine peptidase